MINHYIKGSAVFHECLKIEFGDHKSRNNGSIPRIGVRIVGLWLTDSAIVFKASLWVSCLFVNRRHPFLNLQQSQRLKIKITPRTILGIFICWMFIFMNPSCSELYDLHIVVYRCMNWDCSTWDYVVWMLILFKQDSVAIWHNMFYLYTFSIW